MFSPNRSIPLPLQSYQKLSVHSTRHQRNDYDTTWGGWRWRWRFMGAVPTPIHSAHDPRNVLETFPFWGFKLQLNLVVASRHMASGVDPQIVRITGK